VEEFKQQLPLRQPVAINTSTQDLLFNNQFDHQKQWPEDQYAIAEMSKLGLEVLCKPPFNA
jgi:hypothetical protein